MSIQVRLFRDTRTCSCSPKSNFYSHCCVGVVESVRVKWNANGRLGYVGGEGRKGLLKCRVRMCVACVMVSGKRCCEWIMKDTTAVTRDEMKRNGMMYWVIENGRKITKTLNEEGRQLVWQNCSCLPACLFTDWEMFICPNLLCTQHDLCEPPWKLHLTAMEIWRIW